MDQFQSLPPEVLVIILRGIHIRDLLNLRSINSFFYNFIDANPSLWTHTSFRDSWPCTQNLMHFSKAAKAGNREALIKTGIAYLYNEGFSGRFEEDRVKANGEQAAKAFLKVEDLQLTSEPFTWLFIRPPWSCSAPCCKRAVMRSMKELVKQPKIQNPFLHLCIFKTLQLLEDTHTEDLIQHLNAAIEHGVVIAEFYKWQLDYENNTARDSGRRIASVRVLRKIANRGCWQAQLALWKAYLQGDRGLYTEKQATAAIRAWVQRSPPRCSQVYSDKEFTHSMRYILIDWLVEVAHMKSFESVTLHLAISLLDRFLKKRRPTRAKLQLAGVASLVLASRFLGQDIITIREAAWLTDGTYKYEEVVRMMGEITAALGGKFRVPMTLDFIKVIGLAAENNRRMQCLSEYLCEIVELHSELSSFSLAMIAASCVLIAKLHHQQNDVNGFAWSDRLVEVTGFSVDDLKSCVLTIHEKCFSSKAIVDHRNVELKAVKVRFRDERFCGVADVEVISSEELQQIFEKELPSVDCDTSCDLSESEGEGEEEEGSTCLDLIASPSRCHSGSRPVHFRPDRENAGTPMRLCPDEDSGISWEDNAEYEEPQGKNKDVESSSSESQVPRSVPVKVTVCAPSINCQAKPIAQKLRVPLLNISNLSQINVCSKRKSRDVIGNQLKTHVTSVANYNRL